jgi:MinD-like ATPase involved in chromosome partitioning or flagellar assembly/Tfp pilus assembly protein PilF
MSRFPYIFAFYSFKGGVGRSMALLNVAYALAGRGRHVLMLDMDLEAPGLSEFLKQKEEIITTSKFDIVDLLSWAQSTALDLPSEQNQLAPSVVPKSTDYISSIHPAKIENLKPALGETGHLDVISARLDDSYFDRFSHLSLGSLGQEEIVGTGRVLRAWLKSLVVPVKVPDYYGLGETINVPYDYVLIDSRTGISEIGGLCIGPLSDRLIVLTSLNVQNIEGTKKVLDEVGINKRRDSTDEPWDEADVASSSIVPPRLGPKPTLLVASPIPSGELNETKRRLDECRKRIGPFAAKISYHPQLSVEETIFVRDWPDEYLSGEYAKLADHLMAVVNDHGSQLPPIDPDDFKKGHEFDLERALRAATHRPDDAVATLLVGVRDEANSDASLRQNDRAFRILAASRRVSTVNILLRWGTLLAQHANAKAGNQADQLFIFAFEKYEDALKIKPDNHDALNNWGVALSNQAKQKSGPEADQLFLLAGEKFQAALKIKPHKHDALYNWGNALFAQAKQKSGTEADQLFLLAGEKYQAALKIKPDTHEGLSNWGNALIEQAKQKSGLEADQLFLLAIEKFEAALKIQPKNHKVLNNLGLTLADQARKQNGTAADRLFVQAGEKLAAALKINPDAHESLSNWGYTYLEQAKKKSGPEAARLYELGREKLLKSESIVPGSGAYNLVCLYALQGRDDECLHWLKLVRNQGNLDDIQKLLADSDLDSIRRKDWFRSFVAETLEKSER